MGEFSKKIVPPITLALLSTMIAELLSGSAPPLIFFNPLQFLIRFTLYGCGIIIIRELCIKWKKGWGSILILGLAMGIIWEGLAAKAIFRPTWTGLDIIGTYGRWLDVNWITGIWLVLFHVIYSVTVTILLFNFIYPEKKNERLLTDKKLGVIFVIFCFIILFFYMWISAYDPIWQNFCLLIKILSPNITDDFGYGVTLILTLFCIFITAPYHPDALITGITLLMLFCLFLTAWQIKSDILKVKNEEPKIRPKWFYLVGAIYSPSVFLINAISPYTIPYPVIPIIIEIILFFLLIFFDINYSGRQNKKYHVFALVCGLLSFFIGIAFIQELMGQLGMSIVGIFFILFLYFLKKEKIDKDLN
ncbi:MAG: hypothetical protein ACTSRG_08015 [Candidatus Helarchaeota archaeon]